VKGHAKENFDYIRFGYWDENYFIPNEIGAFMGARSLKP
jgi:hypothetical protein